MHIFLFNLKNKIYFYYFILFKGKKKILVYIFKNLKSINFIDWVLVAGRKLFIKKNKTFLVKFLNN